MVLYVILHGPFKITLNEEVDIRAIFFNPTDSFIRKIFVNGIPKLRTHLTVKSFRHKMGFNAQCFELVFYSFCLT